jgi:hypothetical protein
MSRIHVRGPMCIANVPDTWIKDGTSSLAPNVPSGPIRGIEEILAQRGVHDPDKLATNQFISQVLKSVDGIDGLTDAAVQLQFGILEPLDLRGISSETGIVTVVKIKVDAADKRSWWEKWRGVVLSCGAATAGGVATALSCGATPFTAGASTPVCVASWVGTGASATQCGLAIGKETNEDFQEYVQTDDGQWVNNLDIALDFVSLGVGVASLPNALKAGSQAWKASKYANVLSKVDKGKLTKSLAQIEKAMGEMPKVRQLFEAGLQSAKINPAGKTALTNNIIKRMIPHAIKVLRKEQVENLTAVVGASLSTWGSSYGGVGSKESGIIKIGKESIEIVVEQYLMPEQ